MASLTRLVLVVLALFCAVSASALKPKTVAFLKELGYDAKSAQIKAIAGDSVTTDKGKVKSLDTLAAKRDEEGVKRFIVTRTFVKAYMKDTKTKFPDREYYETSYLKEDEVQFILAELKKPFAALKKTD